MGICAGNPRQGFHWAAWTGFGAVCRVQDVVGKSCLGNRSSKQRHKKLCVASGAARALCPADLVASEGVWVCLCQLFMRHHAVLNTSSCTLQLSVTCTPWEPSSSSPATQPRGWNPRSGESLHIQWSSNGCIRCIFSCGEAFWSAQSTGMGGRGRKGRSREGNASHVALSQHWIGFVQLKAADTSLGSPFFPVKFHFQMETCSQAKRKDSLSWRCKNAEICT